MSDANLPFIIAQLWKAPGRGFWDGSNARPAVAPVPSAMSHPVPAPEKPSLAEVKGGGRKT